MSDLSTVDRPGCPSTGLHGTLHAFRVHGCRCPDARRMRTERDRRRRVPGQGHHSTSRTYDQRDVEIALSRLRAGQPAPRLSAPERRAVIVALSTGPDPWSAVRLARVLGIASRSVVRHRTMARRAA